MYSALQVVNRAVPFETSIAFIQEGLRESLSGALSLDAG
jgi:hypothetical protein